MTKDKFVAHVRAVGRLLMRGKSQSGIAMRNTYRLDCFHPNGELKWTEIFHNKVVYEGLDDMLEQYYRGATYTAAHYLFLMDASPVVADTDTMASHPGWTELTQYDEPARPTLLMDPVASRSISNAGNPGVYTLNANVTLGGLGISTDATKGGSTGLLITGAVLDTGDRAGFIGEKFNATYINTAVTQ